MPDAFLQLPAEDRSEALAVAAAASGRPVHLLEKDVWVVWTLDVLFNAPFAEQLVFKGGTSLSKTYRIIRHWPRLLRTREPGYLSRSERLPSHRKNPHTQDAHGEEPELSAVKNH